MGQNLELENYVQVCSFYGVDFILLHARARFSTSYFLLQEHKNDLEPQSNDKQGVYAIFLCRSDRWEANADSVELRDLPDGPFSLQYPSSTLTARLTSREFQSRAFSWQDCKHFAVSPVSILLTCQQFAYLSAFCCESRQHFAYLSAICCQSRSDSFQSCQHSLTNASMDFSKRLPDVGLMSGDSGVCVERRAIQSFSQQD